MSEINAIHTPCKNCVFAQYEGITQKSCAMDLIEKYQNVETIEILEAYDDDKEFFVINNKKCFSYKEEKYFASKNMAESTLEEKIAYIKDITKIKYTAVINTKNQNIEYLISVLESLSKAEVPPIHYTVVTFDENSIDIGDIHQVVKKVKAKWKIKKVANSDEDFLYTVHQIVGLGAEKSNFTLSINNDYTDTDKVVNKANQMVHDTFEFFSVISNKNKSILLFNNSVYKAGLQNAYDIIAEEESYIIV